MREAGAVTAALAEEVDAGSAIRFSFELQNPSAAQASPAIFAKISGMQFDTDAGGQAGIDDHVMGKDGVSIPGLAGSKAADAFPLKTYGFEP